MDKIEIEKKIITFLNKKGKPTKARIIAREISAIKKEVNGILYSKKVISFNINDNYEWYLLDKNQSTSNKPLNTEDIINNIFNKKII